MLVGNQRGTTLFVCDAGNIFCHYTIQLYKEVLTCISIPSFLAMPLIRSYRMIGFFFRLRRTAVIPCIERSKASEFQALKLEPYNGFPALGVKLREYSEGRTGA